MPGFWEAAAVIAPSILKGIDAFGDKQQSSDEIAQNHANRLEELAIKNQYENEAFDKETELQLKLAAIKAQYTPVENKYDAVGNTRNSISAALGGGQLRQQSVQNALSGLNGAYSLGAR